MVQVHAGADDLSISLRGNGDNTKDYCTLNFIPFYHKCFLCFMNKVVVGSGSEGAPKYAGKGVIYRVFLGYYLHSFACAHHLMCHIRSMRTLSHNIVTLHCKVMSHRTLMTSFCDIVMMS